MPSHSVHLQRALTSRPDGQYDAVLELVCGCVVTRVIPQERTVELLDGTRKVAGKYPCPVDHPVGPRQP